MEKEKSFLDAWKLVMNILVEEGTIKKEEIDEGFQIPYEWLHSSLISRNTILSAMKNIHEKEFPLNKYSFNSFKKYVKIQYIENNGKPAIKISTGNRSVIVIDEKIEPTERWQETISSKEFISEMLNAKKQQKIFEMENNGVSKEVAEITVEMIFDDKQDKIEEIVAPTVLTDMAVNFRRYYEYLHEEEILAQIQKEQDKQLFGGLIEPATDERHGKSPDTHIGETKERVSDIYSFEQRDEILKSLNPERIIKFDSMDEHGEVVQGAYTCYIYAQPQNNDGYLIISEPLEGNKATRTVFVTKEEVDEFCGEQEDLNEFWKEFVRIYIEEMTGSEFRAEENTYVFNHSTDIETYKQKLTAVIKGVDKTNPKHIVAIRASKELYGKVKMLEGIQKTTETGISAARRAIFEERILTEDKGEK